MKQIEVSLLGQTYLLACPDGGQGALLSAVEHVDREMTAIRDAGKVKARERIAVLAALNLAYALAERHHHPAPAVQEGLALELPLSTDSDDPATLARIDQLIHRIDQTLGANGQLL
jgi:cell division protein ZapA